MQETHANISEETLEARKRHRGQIDLLRARLTLFEGRDKVLMTMYVENGNSVRQIARLLGVSEASMSRRIHTLTKRLTDGQYITCLRNRGKFTMHQMDIAKDYFLMGLSIRKIAAKRGWSRYRVHQTVKTIQRLLKAANRQAKAT